MNNVDKKRFGFGRTVSYKRSRGDISVQPGLALTPSQMQNMSERGIPVSSQNLEGVYYDGDTRPSWDVPLDQQRGVDVATMWQRRKDIAAKLRNAPSVESSNTQ